MNSGPFSRVAAIFLVSFIVLALSFVDIVAHIVAVTLSNRRMYLLSLSSRNAFFCWSQLLVGISLWVELLLLVYILPSASESVDTDPLLFCIAFLSLDECSLVDNDPLIAAIFVIGIIHSSLCLHLCPYKIVCPLYTVKSTVHPVLHNLLTDISKYNAKPGILCAHRAFSGNWRNCIVPSYFQVTHRPSGSFVVIGFKVKVY